MKDVEILAAARRVTATNKAVVEILEERAMLIERLKEMGAIAEAAGVSDPDDAIDALSRIYGLILETQMAVEVARAQREHCDFDANQETVSTA